MERLLVGGNLGLDPLDLAGQAVEVALVLELSFLLAGAAARRAAGAGACAAFGAGRAGARCRTQSS